MSHPENLPSVIERYQKEMLRILGVLESVLSKQEWLVGGRCTVADLSFIVWNALILDGTITKTYTPAQFEEDFPAVFRGFRIGSRWHQAMMNRQTVKKIYAIREAFKV
ncbi:uncharacterized protein TRAVEDRAFT_46833 [Trametes versicolor FP-101664 SS1]|uniref:uncharacterized protein n=1 Tax=Trametes versicolor (strain FP-101664) TaxID=717944 RepID=UPI00046233AE|nr:uncharacterized protein TRAVEDRAFT_46833 [Trametes versicolor FP-101664 SS1]EIW59526.1 hypothetical protein TRAVEDRAFT_46833 [Trametes versicolor FP-101664 SS1]